MRLLYSFGIFLYTGAIRFAAIFNSKAAKWVAGRMNWKKELSDAIAGKEEWIWFHCSSLGEFEQGRPLIEELRKTNVPERSGRAQDKESEDAFERLRRDGYM